MKRSQWAQLLPGQVTHQKEAKSPTQQSPQLEHHQVSIPSHIYNAYISSTPSTRQNSIPGKSESIHAITTLMGYLLSSKPGKYIQKWILYHAIHDHIDLWISWDPTDSDDIKLFQKCVDYDGSVSYLPSSTVKNLISLWNYMDLLINKERQQLPYPDRERWNCV